MIIFINIEFSRRCQSIIKDYKSYINYIGVNVESQAIYFHICCKLQLILIDINICELIIKNLIMNPKIFAKAFQDIKKQK